VNEHNGGIDFIAAILLCVGSNISESDLSEYRVRIYPALAMSLLSGHVVHTLRPPSSGVILAFMLRVLEG